MRLGVCEYRGLRSLGNRLNLIKRKPLQPRYSEHDVCGLLTEGESIFARHAVRQVACAKMLHIIFSRQFVRTISAPYRHKMTNVRHHQYITFVFRS